MTIRVLIADDHVVVAEGLRYLISAEPDLEVVGCANDGREAVRMAEKLKPDVVVMDVSMAELNGIDATSTIRRRWPGMQVVILSMYSNQEYVVRALQSGACGYLLKKFAGKEMAAAVRAAHRGERYLSPQISEDIIDDYLRDCIPSNPLDVLSARERQVLQLSVDGRSPASIARTLSLSPKTVNTYRTRLMQKLGMNDLPHLVKFAIQHGITPLE